MTAKRRPVEARRSAHDRALDLAERLRAAGFPVARVIAEGKRVEVVVGSEDDSDPFDRVDLRRAR